MSRAFEPAPLIAAAVIGAIALYVLSGCTRKGAITGAGVGVAVQLGVRLLGVS